MPPKKRKEGGSAASAGKAEVTKKAAGDKDTMKAPQNVAFGKGFLRDAPFTCTLCKSRIDKGTQTLAHFKNHHKITKPSAIEKLVTLGVVMYDPEQTPDDVNDPTSGAESSTSTAAAAAASTAAGTTYAKGDLVLAHITGYPWWPGIVQRIEVEDEDTVKIDVRFFDKDMQTGKVKLTDVKDFKDYQQYLKSKRKALSAATLGKLRQAYEFALKVRSKPAPWRHTYFCVEKHTMFDYNANHDTTEIEEEPLTRRTTSNDLKTTVKRPAVPAVAAATAKKSGQPTAGAAKTAKLDLESGGANKKEEEDEAAAVPEEVNGDDSSDEEDFDEDGCENGVNDVLSEMGYDN